MKLFARTPETGLDAPFEGSDDELAAELARLEQSNRRRPRASLEARLVYLRHFAGVRLLERAPSDPRYAEPDAARLPGETRGLPEIAAADVTPGVLRAGILRDGCLLVRGLIPPRDAARLADGIERAFREREHHDAEERFDETYYSEFTLQPPFDPYLGRPWIKMGGGVYAADAPRPSFWVSEALRRARVPDLASAYLGEPALLSIHKTTLRKALGSVPGTWHQDGKFMGEVRALNLWLSLSRCGDIAPGLDVVPRRLTEFAETGTEESTLDTWVSQTKAEEAAGERGIVRPIFEPGDALLFDEMFLHQTAADPAMPKPRYALEAWFFGGSAFPSAYAPIVP